MTSYLIQGIKISIWNIIPKHLERLQGCIYVFFLLHLTFGAIFFISFGTLLFGIISNVWASVHVLPSWALAESTPSALTPVASLLPAHVPGRQ